MSDLELALLAFQRRLIESQRDLPADAARVLRDNLWQLYDTPAQPARNPSIVLTKGKYTCSNFPSE